MLVSTIAHAAVGKGACGWGLPPAGAGAASSVACCCRRASPRRRARSCTPLAKEHPLALVERVVGRGERRSQRRGRGQQDQQKRGERRLRSAPRSARPPPRPPPRRRGHGEPPRHSQRFYGVVSMRSSSRCPWQPLCGLGCGPGVVGARGTVTTLSCGCVEAVILRQTRVEQQERAGRGKADGRRRGANRSTRHCARPLALNELTSSYPAGPLSCLQRASPGHCMSWWRRSGQRLTANHLKSTLALGPCHPETGKFTQRPLGRRNKRGIG